jgi:hypothetical protein
MRHRQERDPGLRGRLQRGQRVSLGHLTPLGAKLPGPQPDHRDSAAGLTQDAFFHPPRLRAAAPRRPGQARPGQATTGDAAPKRATRMTIGKPSQRDPGDYRLSWLRLECVTSPRVQRMPRRAFRLIHGAPTNGGEVSRSRRLRPLGRARQNIAVKARLQAGCQCSTLCDAGSGAPPAASRPRPRSCRPNTAPRHRRAHRRPRNRRDAPRSR